MKSISSGIILYKREDDETKFFVCTPDGPFWKNRELFNFPKGGVEEGEEPFDAAVREFKEETGVEISKDRSKYVYEGLIAQNKSKDVHVFVKEYEGEDLSNCHSNMCTTVVHGKSITHPEVRGYCWMGYEDLSSKGIRSYLPIYEKISNKV